MNNKSKKARVEKFPLPKDFTSRVEDKINDILRNGEYSPYYRIYDEVSNQTLIVEHPEDASGIEVISMAEGKASGLGGFICFPSNSGIDKGNEREKELACDVIGFQFTSYMHQFFHDMTISMLLAEVLKRKDMANLAQAKQYVFSKIEEVTTDYMPDLDRYFSAVDEVAEKTAAAFILNAVGAIDARAKIKEGKMDEAVEAFMNEDFFANIKEVN